MVVLFSLFFFDLIRVPIYTYKVEYETKVLCSFLSSATEYDFNKNTRDKKRGSVLQKLTLCPIMIKRNLYSADINALFSLTHNEIKNMQYA